MIIGAGPAGLTTAYELLTRTDIRPVILELSERLGGIATTVNYKGNRIDIGGHRFFSKSDRVMNWWLDRMPIQATDSSRQTITYQRQSRDVASPATAPDPAVTDLVMLIRERLSRIYFLRRFFTYPIRLSVDTLKKLGLPRTMRIGLSYIKSTLFPIRDEQNLEHFFINRFGEELYLTFFKSYTEKVWGVPCNRISAEWGAQRIKGLSVWKTILHAVKTMTGSRNGDIAQKDTETSLIEQFLYPKLGPGQMWEEVAREVVARGGEIHFLHTVDKLLTDGSTVTGVEATDTATGAKRTFEGDYVFSTMPVKDLVQALDADVPRDIRTIADGLLYRDFITVGLLVNRMKTGGETGEKLVRDNWIYIQEPDVQVGRLQIFNNWSPYMVADPSKVWLGLEYFCNEGDELWRRTDPDLIALGTEELDKIGLIDRSEVIDATVLRMPKTYPAYFGTYDRFDELRSYLDAFRNLYLIGRNGMHKYNNQDHSMLTAMIAVDNILEGRDDKENIWAVNTEQEYHESK